MLYGDGMSLRERREIVALARGEAIAASGVLMTLVRAAGSSYRAMGARLLALPDGRTAGTISGGCLEADLLRRAAWRVRSGAAVEHFDTSFDDTAEVPFGLGCGGTVDVLLEPMQTSEARAAIDALERSLAGESVRMLTVLPEGSTSLGRMVLSEQGDVLFASAHLHAAQQERLHSAAAELELVDTALFSLDEAERSQACFAERLRAPQRLVIFGAGEDAKPLARMAVELGFRVVVADGRMQQARASRFPAADLVLVAESPAQIPVVTSDAVVVMTHSFLQDRRVVADLLAIAPAYLGLLGARHRSALLLQEAAGLAGVPLATALKRVHAPIGLELGGDGPEAIALAVLAEVQAVLHGRNDSVRHRRMSLANAEHQLQRQPAVATGAEAARSSFCALDNASR